MVFTIGMLKCNASGHVAAIEALKLGERHEICSEIVEGVEYLVSVRAKSRIINRVSNEQVRRLEITKINSGFLVERVK